MISFCTMLFYILFWCITRGKKRKWGKMLFTAYFFDFIFQHLNDINMLVSGYKVEKQTIAHSILIIVKAYRSIGNSRNLMA